MNAPQFDFSAMRFFTDDLPARNRLAMCREFLGRAVMKLDLEPLSDDPFHDDLTVRRIPGLDVVSSVVSPGRASRTPALVADGNDDVALLICSSAGTAFQRGRETKYGVGDAIVRMNAEPDTVCFPSGGRFLSLQMPRAALAPLVTDLDNAALLPPIPPSNETLQYLLSYIRFLQADGALGNPELARAAAIHLRDLAVLMLGATRDAGVVAERRSLRVARLEAIKTHIADRLHHPGLTVTTVAARHGITPRYVQLLFEGEGTTFSLFVLRQRLARAHRMLSDPRFARHSISTIATEAGFDDISYFNRCFRRRYGATPSDIREQARWDGA